MTVGPDAIRARLEDSGPATQSQWHRAPGLQYALHDPQHPAADCASQHGGDTDAGRPARDWYACKRRRDNGPSVFLEVGDAVSAEIQRIGHIESEVILEPQSSVAREINARIDTPSVGRTT